MSVVVPSIAILGRIPLNNTSVSQSWNSAVSGSPDYNGVPLTFLCTFQIETQPAAYPDGGYNSSVYSANDILPGFIYAQYNGQVYDVVTVSASNATNATIGLRDTNGLNSLKFWVLAKIGLCQYIL